MAKAMLPKVTFCPSVSRAQSLEEKATLLTGSAPVAISPRSPPKPSTCPLIPTTAPQHTQLHRAEGVRTDAAPGT